MPTTYAPSAEKARPRVSVLLVVGLAAVLASAFLVGGARSASQAQGLIAFTRSDGIYVMRTDGSGTRALLRGGVALGAFGLAWSPDGSKLAFAVGIDPTDPNDRGDRVALHQRGIWVMNADGSNLMHLVEGRMNSPTWSADGRKIAFSYGDIWVMNADGSNRRQLTKTPSLGEEFVDWSPAGDRIAFATSDFVHLGSIYVMSTDGRNVRKLGEGSEPDWSPDGRRIAFESWVFYPSELYIMDANGRSRVRLTRNDVNERDSVWSPDGRKIAFVRGDPAKTSTNEIYLMNAGGGGLRRLTHNRIAEGNPAWQPVAAP